jgi:hypothetical protein
LRVLAKFSERFGRNADWILTGRGQVSHEEVSLGDNWKAMGADTGAPLS